MATHGLKFLLPAVDADRMAVKWWFFFVGVLVGVGLMVLIGVLRHLLAG